MTRIPQITSRDQVTADAWPIFDAITASRGNVRGPFSVLMHSPELAGRAAHLGTFVRFESHLDAPVRELAVLVAARECECAYEWGTHVVSAHEAGISDAAIDVVRRRLPVDALPADQQALISYVRQIVNEHKVSDAVFAAAYALLGDHGIAELTATIGYYSLLACVLNAFEVPPAPGGELLPA